MNDNRSRCLNVCIFLFVCADVTCSINYYAKRMLDVTIVRKTPFDHFIKKHVNCKSTSGLVFDEKKNSL